MISDAAVMSNPASRGNPLPTPPSEQTMWRKARSFMSSTRRQTTRRTSIPVLSRQWMLLSTMALSKL